ncbi:hypothetical protein [Gorillibacterium timonense]|uniref:hypothetical protein n=1 Tax=Gorillibacterium timonense TaxID=1689269 RepID=UPI00071C7A07|nr:hypothetical protein [Gorillibacterium timonense]
MKIGVGTNGFFPALQAGEMTVEKIIKWTAEHGGEHVEIVPLGFELIGIRVEAGFARHRANFYEGRLPVTGICPCGKSFRPLSIQAMKDCCRLNLKAWRNAGMEWRSDSKTCGACGTIVFNKETV